MLKETENQSTIATVQVAPETSQLTARHYKECTEKRGLNPQWVLANCLSVIANYATQYLGYTAKSDGIWLKGCNHQSQYKPDKPWKSEGDKKAAKYRSPLGEYDAMLPTHPTEPHYWDDIETLKKIAYKIEGHPCLVLTEGFFKAIAGCSNGIPTIALLGVEMGLTSKDADPQGKRYLVKTLECYARAGFGFIFALDADCADNKNVLIAQHKLAHQLKLFKAPLYSATGLWTVAEGKGMDDYIHNHGGEQFKRKVLGKVIDITAWEKQFQAPELPKTGKVPPADVVAHGIADQYKDQLAFNNEIGRWMRYGADSPGMWSLETDEYLEAIVGTVLDGKNIVGYGSYSYLTNVVKTLRRLLIVRRWQERSPKELLPFINGVLEVSTGNLLDHSPGYRLTWQLPRNHDSNATDWSTIDAYLDHLSNGKVAIKDILVCFCNAVLKGRGDLQKFLHLIGLAGSGKGTFARLLTELIGSDNIYSGTLDDWCSNRFDSANAYKKRLVVFWDEDKQTGKLGKFLSLTGGDWIRAEEKGKKAFQYRYDGMVAVLSNIPIFTGDAASRIARRVITIPCNSNVPLGQRRDLNAEFSPELDAFTNHVLSIPDSHVTKVLMGLADIPECTLEFWENRLRTDSIAAWINDWIIYDVLAETPIGSNKEEGLEGSLPQTLYGSYCLHCKQSGTQPKANKNFSPDLLELCRSVVGWETERKVTKTGKFIKGLRLRTDGDGNIPTHDYNLMQRVTGGDGLGDGLGDGSEHLLDKVFSESDDSTLTSNENHQPELLLQAEHSYEQEIDSNSSLTLDSLPEEVIDPSPAPVTAPVTVSAPTKAPQPAQRELVPATPTRQPQVFRVGDRTHYSGAKGAMAVTCRGKELEVLNTRVNDQGEQECEVKASSWCASYWLLSRCLKKVR
ncbi:MAG: DUF3854 domain-containing protein [Gloeocapsa sp. UFS-A4-WI-NPMV-4B04]|jgi:putative DNA primase/helicase|nr:DUF3854 domain-containing protein [Gloeocapsa sp. UFS-A4-WI-NPMV-4B04]